MKKFILYLLLLPAVAGADVTSIVTFPAGQNKQIQFNQQNRFGADSTLIFSTSTKFLSVPGIAVSTLTLNGVTYTFPATQGNGGLFLKNDGAGGLTWDAPFQAISGSGASFAVNDGAVQISSPTSTIKFSPTQFIIFLQDTTTAFVSLDPIVTQLGSDIDLSGVEATGNLPAARIAAGTLGTSVIASSIAVNAVQDASIVGVTGSKVSGNIPGNAVGITGTVNISQVIGAVTVYPATATATFPYGVHMSTADVDTFLGVGGAVQSGFLEPFQVTTNCPGCVNLLGNFQTTGGADFNFISLANGTGQLNTYIEGVAGTLATGSTAGDIIFSASINGGPFGSAWFTNETGRIARLGPTTIKLYKPLEFSDGTLQNSAYYSTSTINNQNSLQSGATAYPDFLYVGTSETVKDLTVGLIRLTSTNTYSGVASTDPSSLNETMVSYTPGSDICFRHNMLNLRDGFDGSTKGSFYFYFNGGGPSCSTPGKAMGYYLTDTLGTDLWSLSTFLFGGAQWTMNVTAPGGIVNSYGLSTTTASVTTSLSSLTNTLLGNTTVYKGNGSFGDKTIDFQGGYTFSGPQTQDVSQIRYKHLGVNGGSGAPYGDMELYSSEVSGPTLHRMVKLAATQASATCPVAVTNGHHIYLGDALGGGRSCGVPVSLDFATSVGTVTINYDLTQLTISTSVTIAGNLAINNTEPLPAIKVNQTGNIPASSSVGGAINITNTNNTGAALVAYSNQAAPTDNLINLRVDNTAFSQNALFVDYRGGQSTTAGTITPAVTIKSSNVAMGYSLNVVGRSSATSTMQLSGEEAAVGTFKITHSSPTLIPGQSDANAAALSIALAGAGTQAQGIFIDAASRTSGKLLNLRNGGVEQLTLAADGTLTNLFGIVGGSVTVNNGFFKLQSRTKAQLAAYTPGGVNEMFYCSDCTNCLTAISTGTATGALSSMQAANRTTVCN